MHSSLHELIYLIGFVVFYSIRLFYLFVVGSRKPAETRRSLQEHLLLIYAAIAFFLLPLFAIFTPTLAFADFALSQWTAFAGAILFFVSIFLFWRSHADLGRNWSATLDVQVDHELVTRGVYTHIRHPMYLSLVLFGLAQALLIGNWITTLAGLSSALAFPLLRVPHEEKMMADHFGAEWAAYRARTGALLPWL